MNQRGSILLAALITTLMATMIVIGAAYHAGMRLESQTQVHDGEMALICAQAGLEAAARMAAGSETWATDLAAPTWLSATSVGRGVVEVNAADPCDGLIAPLGASGSSSADTVRLTATGTVGNVTRTLMADYVPLPHEAMRYVGYSRSTIGLQNVEVQGRLRAHGDVMDQGDADVRGTITTSTGDSVWVTLDDDDVDVKYSATNLTAPSIDFSWFVDAGEKMNRPPYGIFDNTVIIPEFNPTGGPSAEGIYWVDAAGGDLYFYHVYIEACIVVLNANVVVIGWSGSAEKYYHRSPDPDRLPALLVDGDIYMQIEGGSISYGGGGYSFTVDSEFTGVVGCTGEFWGPQMYASNPITFEGAVLANELHFLGPGTMIRHDPDLDFNPMVELTRAGLRVVPGSTREL